MAIPFIIKQHDLEPKLKITLFNGDGSPIDLTTAVSVKFIMKAPTGSAKINAACTFIDRPAGIVQYTWTGTDTDTVQQYNCEVEIVWPGSPTRPQTVPNDGYFTVTIGADLG